MILWLLAAAPAGALMSLNIHPAIASIPRRFAQINGNALSPAICAVGALQALNVRASSFEKSASPGRKGG
ncbi:hypothetical protein KCP73_01090 [Salmonella enterica subsp. enterica]|nr:hypothetical protein KCP73_01090 [Salmonella enterica subsp. enterica]